MKLQIVNSVKIFIVPDIYVGICGLKLFERQPLFHRFSKTPKLRWRSGICWKDVRVFVLCWQTFVFTVFVIHSSFTSDFSRKSFRSKTFLFPNSMVFVYSRFRLRVKGWDVDPRQNRTQTPTLSAAPSACKRHNNNSLEYNLFYRLPFINITCDIILLVLRHHQNINHLLTQLQWITPYD